MPAESARRRVTAQHRQADRSSHRGGGDGRARWRSDDGSDRHGRGRCTYRNSDSCAPHADGRCGPRGAAWLRVAVEPSGELLQSAAAYSQEATCLRPRHPRLYPRVHRQAAALVVMGRAGIECPCKSGVLPSGGRHRGRHRAGTRGQFGASYRATKISEFADVCLHSPGYPLTVATGGRKGGTPREHESFYACAGSGEGEAAAATRRSPIFGELAARRSRMDGMGELEARRIGSSRGSFRASSRGQPPD